MSSCRTCGKELPSGATVCPDDGTKVQGAEPTMMLEDNDLEPVSAGTSSPATSTAAAKAADLKPGQDVSGYVIDAKIGQGGMGVVYGAHHPRIGKKVAIKVLSPLFCGDPTTVERFEQEARLVNEIRHPNIVDVFQFGELPDGRSFFVMEWLEGEGLGARVEKGALPPAETIEILDVICDALEAAHEAGVIHRDLKSDNVFLVKGRNQTRVKLLDFGLAKLAASHDGGAMVKTQTGVLMGTPAYMSPEQARGKNVDHRTDIYALGCLAYKMLTGHLPFNADNAMDVLVQQLSLPAPSPTRLAPNTPEALSRVIVAMMAKSPDDRPSLAQVRQILSDIRAGGGRGVGPKPTRFTPVTPMEAVRPPSKEGIGWVIPAIIVLAIAGGVVYMKFLRKEPGDDAVASAPAANPPPAPAPTPSPAPTPEPEAVPPAPEPEPEMQIEPTPTPAPAATPDAAPRRVRPTTTATPTPTPEPPEPFVPTPGAILLTLEEPSAVVEIDGKTMSHNGKGGRYELPPGRHVLVVTAPGREAVRHDLEIKPGGTISVHISEGPAAPAPQPE